MPEGSVAGGGIGCHAMVAFTGRPESQVTSITQMGGEGAQWIGQAPYTDARHMFQNMGDGTFAHSGQLAVQACVAAGVSITYKLLFNRAVAMTGGQDAAGGLEVPELAAKLLAEGVARIIVCADEPERFRALAPLPPGSTSGTATASTEAQRALAATPGVTVLIYDQRCAAESRRLRKRGAIPVRTTRVVINEAVCEGCGDCGVKSNCLSVQPVETELGRKTHIDQTSCNTDYSCLAGDCPSFVTVEVDPSAATARRERPEPPAGARRRPARLGRRLPRGHRRHRHRHRQPGARLGRRPRRAGGARRRPDRACRRRPGRSRRTCGSPATPPRSGRPTGSARRAATWRSTCSSGPTPATSATPMRRRPSPSSPPVRCRPDRWCATRRWPRPTSPTLVERIAGRSRALVGLDAQAAANALFGDAMPANLLLVGAAYQSGALPLSAEAIEWAIELNGVAVAVNTAAFRWGRVAVADPAAFAAATAGAPVPTPPVWTELGELAGETRRLAGIRARCSPTTRTRARPVATSTTC